MNRSKTLLAAAVLALGAGGALATPATNLPPVIVEASRVASEEMTMASPVRILTRSEVGSSGARNLPELLEKEGGLLVRHLNANPMQSSLSMRGFGENSFGRVLVLVDGERLNNPDMEAPNLTRVPLSSVERIEILEGPQTVLYGDAASAGVVHIRTVPGEEEGERSSLSFTGGSWDTYGLSLYRRGKLGEKGTMTTSLDWSTSDGYRQNGGYDLWHLSQGLRHRFADGSSLRLSIFADRGFYEMPGALSEADYSATDRPRKAKDGSATEDEADFYTYGLAFSGCARLSDSRRLEMETSVSRRRRDASWRGLFPVDSSYDSWALSVTPRYIDETPWLDRVNVLLLGADLHGDWYDVETTSSFGTEKPDYRRVSYAGFLRDEFFVTEKVSLLAGTRGERFESRWKAQEEDRWTWDEFAWEGGLNIRPVEELKLFGRVSRFYRAPFCDEMNYVRFNDSLEPETGLSLDAGVTWKPSREFTFTLSGYHMELEDEIFFNPRADKSLGTWMGYNENSPAKTRRSGFDIVAGWRREKTGSLQAAYRYVDASFTEGPYDGKEVPLVPEQVLQLSAEWYLCEMVAVGCDCRFLGSQSFAGDFENAHGKIPGYGLLDGRLRLEPPAEALDGLALELTVANLLDRRHSDFAGWNDLSGRYYYPGAGRSFLLSVRYEF